MSSMTRPHKFRGTGATAIAVSTDALPLPYRLLTVTCKFNAAPTTSENFTATLNAVGGAAYDTVLLSTDPSVTSATSIVYSPDEPILLMKGDQIDVAYTNTDTKTYGVEITMEPL